MTIVKFSTISILIILIGSCVKAPQDESGIIQQAPSNKVSSLKIITLSTMLVNFTGMGEWGYSALVEVDGKKILFDTGKNPETVLRNAQDLGINLSDVEHVFLSHNHGDHTGGILTLRKELKKNNPNALTKVHVATGIFASRLNRDNQMRTKRMLAIKKELEAGGVEIIVHKNQYELFPGVWITGPIKRIHNEKNWYEGGKW